MNCKLIQVLLWMFVMMSHSLVAQPTPEEDLADRYFESMEFESALDMYEKLDKKAPSEKIATRIITSLEKLNRFKEALEYEDRIIRRLPQVVMLPVLKMLTLEKMGSSKEADKLFDEILSKTLQLEAHFMQVGSFLYQAGKLDQAVKVYLAGRNKLKGDYLFSEEIANIYSIQGQYAAATREYLNLYFQNPTNESLISLSLINMVSPESMQEIESALLPAVDKHANDLGLRKMLFEFYLSAENYEEAFIQVKSIDRLFREDGGRIFQFSQTLRNGKNYDLSNKALDYIVERKKESPYYLSARIEKAVNNELKAFDVFPINVQAIRDAAKAYEVFLDEFGRNSSNFEAVYRLAKLKTFYLYELDAAEQEIERLLPQLGYRTQQERENRASAMLLLGDILLMKQDYNRSKLVYEEVSEQFRDRQIGALAKYKLALLSYYKGEFKLSQALLSAIKDNTSNDISNDAIKLNLVIMDNTGMDTSTKPLEMFAQAQLLTYQYKYDASIELMDSLIAKFPGHSLADEIYWEKANIYLQRNEVQTALGYMDRILENFQTDIYGDDALYTKARIFEFNLKDTEKAQELYLEFLTKYPGSLYSVEVRKRIRELRENVN